MKYKEKFWLFMLNLDQIQNVHLVLKKFKLVFLSLLIYQMLPRLKMT